MVSLQLSHHVVFSRFSLCKMHKASDFFLFGNLLNFLTALSRLVFFGSALIPSTPYLIIFRHDGQVKHFFLLQSWLLELTTELMQPLQYVWPHGKYRGSRYISRQIAHRYSTGSVEFEFDLEDFFENIIFELSAPDEKLSVVVAVVSDIFRRSLSLLFV
jgi:hypothetical protein